MCRSQWQAASGVNIQFLLVKGLVDELMWQTVQVRPER
jgi:hypothetical protein